MPSFRLIRLRFSLGKGELPDLEVGDLSKYLLFLLGSGTPRPPLPFPRAQRGWDLNGFPIFQRLGRRQRWELAHSLASLKRSLPGGCKHHTSSSFSPWLAKATSSPPPTSPAYLAFVRKVCRRVFRFGWDETYDSFLESPAPRVSARFGLLTKASVEWASRSSYDEYQLACLHGKLPSFLCGSYRLRYKEVPSAGKCRPLGIPSLEYDLLAPLHKTMYQYLSTKSWLLKGPPTAAKIGDCCVGRLQTSVDLTGATDNLSLDVTEAILGVALAKSVRVPGPVKVWACESLYPTIYHRGSAWGSVSHGQMMGTYLSFPLLCLQSYCAALWAGRDSGIKGILVNGDDTLISSDRPLGDYPVGMILNRQKSIVCERTAEVNSTVFLKSAKGWREVRNLRRGGAVDSFEGIDHVAKACVKAGPKWVEAFVRSRYGRRWRLLPSELGLPLTLQACWHYECSVLRRTRKSLGRIAAPQTSLSRYVQMRQEPDPDEKIAFARDLFNRGREFFPSDDTKISWWSLERRRRRVAVPYRSTLSFSRRAWSREEKKEKVWSYLPEYEGRCRALREPWEEEDVQFLCTDV